MISFWTFLLRKRQFTVLLTAALIAAGTYSLLAIPKESTPEVKIPVAVITTLLPGASAEDVEKLVTNPLEDAVQKIENADTVTSSSRDSLSVITIEFQADADLDESLADVKDAVDTAKAELPDDAEDPNVTDINFSEQPVLLASVTGPFTALEMTRLADIVETEIESVPGVARAEISGVRERQVNVIVAKEKLLQYGLGLADVVSGIRSANATFPVGSIDVDEITYALQFAGDLSETREVADIPLTTRTGVVYLRDVATVSDGLAASASFSRTSVEGAPSTPSLSVSVFKTPGGNILSVADAARERLFELKTRPEFADAEMLVSYDLGEEIRGDLIELSRVGLETVILVMATLFLTIGWRESLVAGASIPLSFLIAFIGLLLSGNTVNFMSLFSLILAIGILVDSGIVVTEAIHTRTRRFATKDEAAVASLREYAWPLIAGTMTTIVVFAPLFFLSGIIGEFIATIPFTIIGVLLASIFVALGIVPLIAVLFTTRTMNRIEQAQERYTEAVTDWYKRSLGDFLGNRKRENAFLGLLTLAFIVAILLPVTGAVKSIFFPSDTSPLLYIEIEKPSGSTLASTDLAARRVEELLYGDQDIEGFVTTVGSGSSFNSNASNGSRYANITVLLTDAGEESSSQVAERLRDLMRNIRTATVKVYEPSSGPPTGAPIVVRFLGDDLGDLEIAAVKAEDMLASIPGISETDSSVKNTGVRFTLALDKAKAAEAGVTPLMVASALRTAVSGAVATKIREDGENIDVEVRLALNPSFADISDINRTDPDAIRALTVEGMSGPVTLGSIMSVELERSRSAIAHEDGERQETVSAYLAPGANVLDATSAFEEAAASLELPEGVTMEVGGENEDIAQSFKEMFIAFVGGIVLMLAILVLEFNSFRKTLYLLLIVPLSLIGVFFGLLVMGEPLSFSSLLGVIALAGVIINHAIILMDSMHRIGETRTDLSFKETVIEAAASRLRPIILTTVTTVVGMIPLAGASAIWGPLAYAIMFGLTFSMILTLILIPLLYHRWPGKDGAKRHEERPEVILLPASEGR